MEIRPEAYYDDELMEECLMWIVACDILEAEHGQGSRVEACEA